MSTKNSILKYRQNVFSQNGEDGILDFIFKQIGQGDRISCEFGAWDGLHLSNCRKLILEGWQCIMIEGDKARFEQLRTNYKNVPSVLPVNCFVDNLDNSIDIILNRSGVKSLDLLSIDIDGLDYDVMSSIQIKPRVICVEVNAGHDPESDCLIPTDIAKNNVGQSLGAFVKKAYKLGYSLVAYNGNAFFMRNDCLALSNFSSLTAEEAYDEFLAESQLAEREWLYLVNLGKVPPFYKYANKRLTAAHLGIKKIRVAQLSVKFAIYIFVRSIKRFFLGT